MPTRRLGYYDIIVGGERWSGAGSGNFYVEEYKKPEYQVTVKPAAAAHPPGQLHSSNHRGALLLRRAGSQRQSEICCPHLARITGGMKTKTTATTPTATAPTKPSGDSDYTYGATEQQEHEGVLDANGRLTVTLPDAIDGKHHDQDYRIEARVTDAGEREVSRPLHGARHLWLVPRKRRAHQLRLSKPAIQSR